MSLKVENRGAGFIGEIGAGWGINYNSTPAILGSGSGRLGDISFSARCAETTKFTIDNYISVQHYFDNPTQRALGAFDGHIRSVELGPDFAQFGMTSLLASLDVTRQAEANPSGTYQRTFEIPPTSYVVAGNTYYIGGRLVSQGSQNVFIDAPIEVYDAAAAPGFVYLLVAGGHSGEVVISMRSHGEVSAVWPVYSDATDLANPGSRFISYEDGYVFVGQQTAKRIKKFNVSGGVFVTQWGSSGSADGQFNTISGVAASPDFDAVYVTDSILGRVQCFTEAGVFLFKWGVSGTTAGNNTFNAPNGVSVERVTGNVLVSDENARVRMYANNGVYLSQPMGSYDFALGVSTGEFAKNQRIRTTFDHRGNAYAYNSSTVFKFTKKGSTNWVASGNTSVQSWTTAGTTGMPSITGSPDGILYVGIDGTVAQYAGSLGSTGAHIMYYIALAKPDMPINMLVLSNDDFGGTIAYPGWRDNVWGKICELLSVTGNGAIVFDGKIAFATRNDAQFVLPKRGQIDIRPMQIDSRASGRAIEIVNQNTSWQDHGVVYSATADGDRVFTVGVNDFTYVRVSQNTYPAHVYDPVATTSTGVAGPGEYIVIDKNGVLIAGESWTNRGGRIRAEIGKDPGDILLTIYGPREVVPGSEAPYRIANMGGTAALNILGQGVMTNPEVITIGTGVSEEVTSREVAVSSDCPFVHSALRAYSEGSWMAYDSGTPNQRYEIAIRYTQGLAYNASGGRATSTAWLTGTCVVVGDAQYIIESVRATNSQIILTTYRYSRTGVNFDGRVSPRMEEIWAGKQAADFDAFWAGYTAQDVTIAPYRNPYGVTGS